MMMYTMSSNTTPPPSSHTWLSCPDATLLSMPEHHGARYHQGWGDTQWKQWQNVGSGMLSPVPQLVHGELWPHLTHGRQLLARRPSTISLWITRNIYVPPGMASISIRNSYLSTPIFAGAGWLLHGCHQRQPNDRNREKPGHWLWPRIASTIPWHRESPHQRRSLCKHWNSKRPWPVCSP